MAIGGVTPPSHGRFVVRRVLLAVPVILGVTLLTFFVLDILPGNAARQLLGAEATPEQVARMEAQLHLNEPTAERYAQWLSGLLTGDLGKSLASRQPVASLVAERVPVTLQLIALAFAMSLLLAVPAALLGAHRPGGAVDRLLLLLSTTGLSLASYVLAPLLIMAFAIGLKWFPSIGYVPLSEGVWRSLRTLCLPAASIALPLFGFYSQFLRGDLIEQMRTADYVTTAYAKGLSSWAVLTRHALRNSAFGLLALIGLNVGTLIGSTVIVEQIFALPGLGQLLLQGINFRDAPLVQAIVVLLALATVMCNLVVDLLYAALDPRIRYVHA